MPRDRKPQGNYEVGYGKPPAHTRFKPGQSGNPKGRSKGVRNLKSILVEEFNRPVMVVENGRSRKAPILAVIARQSLGKAAKGDLRAFLPVLTLAQRVGLLGEADLDEPRAQAPLTVDEEALLRELLASAAVNENEGGP